MDQNIPELGAVEKKVGDLSVLMICGGWGVRTLHGLKGTWTRKAPTMCPGAIFSQLWI